MFDAVNQQWQQLYGQLGGAMPMAGNDNGTPQYSQANYGDLGYNGGGMPGSADFLKSIGWTGGDPYQNLTGSGENGAGPIGPGGIPVTNPYETSGLLDWLKNSRLTLQQRANPNDSGINDVRAIDANGNQVGGLYQQHIGNDDAFGAAAMAAGLFAGGAAGAFGAGTMGAPAASTGADLGAFEGIGSGVGGSGAGVSGMPEGFSAYTGAGSAPGYAAGPGGLSTEAVGGGTLGAEDLGAFEGIGSGAGGSGAAAAGGGGAAGGGAAGGGLMSNLGDIGSWAKANPGLVNLGGSALNGLIGAYTGNKALDRQTDATNQANALWAPYREAGTNAVGRLNGLMQNPSSITQDPGYQFGMNQGVQARDRSAASQGGLYSGATQKALTRYGQDYAGTKLNDAYARYGNVAQLGATGTTNMSNNLTNLGQAGAGAAMYQGNVANNAVNNALGQWNFSNSGYGVPWNQSQYGKPTGP